MATLDALVSQGLSLTQAQAILGVNVGTANANDLVTQGLFVTQATAVINTNSGTMGLADLVSSGFSLTQAQAIVAALAANNAPTANAGPDQTVTEGDVVTLTGAGSSDVNGDPLTYAWTLATKPGGSTAALTGATTVSPTFTADVVGVYSISLVVNDGTVNSAPDTVTVTAEAAP
jgi:hypothetical protein